jgi:hypothetical protein
VAGSYSGKRERDPLWRAPYEKAGFSVFVEDRRGGSEQGVDDVLHAQAMTALQKDFGKGKLSQTLVLVTGDGNDNDGRTSFPKIVDAAMKINPSRETSGNTALWKVEIMSWKRGLSGRLIQFQTEYSDHVSIRYLDNHRQCPPTETSSGCH